MVFLLIIASFEFLIAMLPGFIIVLTGKLMTTFWKNHNVHTAGSGRSVKAKRSFETSEITDQSIRRNCLRFLGSKLKMFALRPFEKSVTLLVDTTKRYRRLEAQTVSCLVDFK